MGNKTLKTTIVSLNRPAVIINSFIYWLSEEELYRIYSDRGSLLDSKTFINLSQLYSQNISDFSFTFKLKDSLLSPPEKWNIIGSFIRPEKNLFLNIDEYNYVTIWDKNKVKPIDVTDKYYKGYKGNNGSE